MPMNWTKHLEEGVIDISDFQGGINVSVPRSGIADNECEWIENFYFDPSDGRLATRWPVDKYSASAAVASTAVDGLFYWNDTFYLTCNATAYYLDSNKAPQSIGSLSSSSKPTFLPFNGKLLVASGGVLQAIATGNTISNVANAPKCTYLLEKDSSVVASGDPDNPDRVYQSQPFDETDWTGGSANYADVGYKDKLSVYGIHEAYDGLYIIFKRATNAVRTYFLSSLSETAPSCRNVSDSHCAVSHHSIVDAASRVFFSESRAITALLGVDSQGKIVIDPSVGVKLSSIIDNASTCHAVVYPPDKQIWFIPDSSLNRAYIHHYLKNGAWTSFTFGSRKISSAYYQPNDQKLYLGMDDGYVYIYNKNDYSFQDDGSTNYTQWIKTKVFDTPPHRNKDVKFPMVFYEGLADGTATLAIKSNFGRTSYYEASFTLDSASTRLYDTQSIYLYDTKAGGSEEMYLYDERSATQLEVFQRKATVDNFQFVVTVTSGAMRVEKIVAQIAATQEKK